MFKIENKNINITRGDVGTIELSILNKDGSTREFVVGDEVRLGVFTKKNMSNIVLQKDVIVQEAGETVDIELSEEDTKIGDIINKPVDYWYEIQLNPSTNPQTVIGYDEEGAKIFRLYPEGVEQE